MIQPHYGIDVPQHLQDLAERHQRHIAELITMLRATGMNEISIEEAVDELIANYRAQLIAAVKAIGGTLD